MHRVKKDKKCVGDKEVPLTNLGTPDFSGYLTPYRGLLTLFNGMDNSPSTVRGLTLIIRSIHDGDMELLQRCLENCGLTEDIFKTEDKKMLSIVHLACLYDRPQAVSIIFKSSAAQYFPPLLGLSTLSYACLLNRFAIIESLLQNGVDPTGEYLFGTTVLHSIARLSTAAVAEFIYDKHNIVAPVDILDGNNASPLHYAAQRGAEDMCHWLLAHRAEVFGRDSRKMTPFMYACQSGEDKVLPLLISADGAALHEHLNDVDDQGMTALHYAVVEGRMQVTVLLLSMGAPVNATTDGGFMPLHLCAATDQAALIPVLLRNGAILEARDPTNKTPLHKASEHGSLNCSLKLIQEGADINSIDDGGMSPLAIACYKGYVEIVGLLLDMGADFTLTNHMKRSCLHKAVEYGHLDVVQCLLKKCPRSFAAVQDVTLLNALHLAASIDNKIVEALIAYDELINVGDLLGRLPLHHAARFGTPATVNTLAKVTKDINVKSLELKTPLILACEAHNKRSVEILQNMGADIVTRDFFDHNALMAAASNGSTSIVKDLIKAGADVNSTDKKKNTALHYACAKNYLSTVKTLVKNGASIKSINVQGNHPFLEALEEGHSDIVTFLMSHERWEDCLLVGVEKMGPAALMDKMIARAPQAVLALLDNCMKKSNHPPNHPQYQVSFSYRYLDPGPDDMMECSLYNAIETFIQYKRVELLAHPVCQSLLALKWRTFGQYALFLTVTMQLFFFIILGIYIITTQKSHAFLNNEECQLNDTNSTNCSLKESEDHEIKRGSLAFYLRTVLYICIGIQLCKELRFLISLGRHYFSSIQNVLVTIALIAIIYSLVPPGIEPSISQWRVLCYATIFISINNCMIFLRVDFIGIYFSMFFEVIRGILKISCLLLFFIFTLSLPLSILMRNQDGFRDGDPVPLTTLAMTLGELNFRDNIIKGNNKPFDIDLYIIFPIFAIILPIAVVNLMIGTAVGDISKVEKGAYLLRMRNQMTFLMDVEKAIPRPIRRRLHYKTYSIQPNKNRKTLWGQLQKHLMTDERIEFISKDTDREDDDDDFKEVVKRQNLMIQNLTELTLSLQQDIKTLRGNKEALHREESDDLNLILSKPD